MSRTIQVNIRVTPEEHARLLKCAGDAGFERGVFTRGLVMEGLDRIAGGEPMVQCALPGPGHLIAMDAMLNKAIMEIERFTNKWAAHEAELLSMERKDQVAMHSARVEFLNGFPERISRSLEPIKKEMTAMMAAITDQPRLDAIDKKQAELVEAVRENTEAIKEVREDPRTVTGLVLGDDRFWSSATICLWSLFMAGVGALFIIGLGKSVPAVGIPLAHKMAVGDAEFCRLVRYHFEAEICQVPVGHRTDPIVKPAAAAGKGSRPKAGTTSPKVKLS
jgi:hypothetical protein